MTKSCAVRRARKRGAQSAAVTKTVFRKVSVVLRDLKDPARPGETLEFESAEYYLKSNSNDTMIEIVEGDETQHRHWRDVHHVVLQGAIKVDA